MVTVFAEDDPAILWPEPDLSVLQSGERPPPQFPIEVFGGAWGDWITAAANASACPVDYVAGPLLAGVSGLIGNARWAKVTSTWVEPPHLWVGSVGYSGNGKSPGADPLMRTVLPAIERRMAIDFPDNLREWQMAAEFIKAQEDTFKGALREAIKKGTSPPPPPPPRIIDLDNPPQEPRLRQYDVTIEKVATLLATAAPKGLLITRDELSGWIEGMSAYNVSGRSFWLEAYGGRPYRVERQKLPKPIDIPRLAVAVYGSTQPDKLVSLMRDFDDGLMARFLWAWPTPVEFRIGREVPQIEWAINSLDKLRELDLTAENPPQPILLPVAAAAVSTIEELGRNMQQRQRWAGGMLCSAFGKARGHVLRLSLTLEFLWWCGAPGFEAPPAEISEAAVAAADLLVDDYFVPMAERVYGDAALPEVERLTTTLARWIKRQQPVPETVNARNIQRAKLPGLREAVKVATATNNLIDADWLRPIPNRAGGTPGRQRADFAVNPRLRRAVADV